jgi:hypothetical protein
MYASMSRTIVMAVGLIFASPVLAQSTIAELIEQTGVEAGSVALRDMPGWREPKKIVMPDVGLSRQELEALLPGIEVVVTRSQSEAIANAKGADAVLRTQSGCRYSAQALIVVSARTESQMGLLF